MTKAALRMRGPSSHAGWGTCPGAASGSAGTLPLCPVPPNGRMGEHQLTMKKQCRDIYVCSTQFMYLVTVYTAIDHYVTS